MCNDKHDVTQGHFHPKFLVFSVASAKNNSFYFMKSKDLVKHKRVGEKKFDG